MVSQRQRGNPLLQHIRNVAWEFAPSPILPDYLIGDTTCLLYLSLRYHLLHPAYLLSRLSSVRHHYSSRALLLQVDSEDSEHALQEITKAAFINSWTLLLCWSPEEAARYIELFKVMEHKGKETLEGGEAAGEKERLSECLQVVKGVNKSDVTMLMSTFGSLAVLSRAGQDELRAVPGMGEKKVRRLRMALQQPFVTSRGIGSNSSSSTGLGTLAKAKDKRKEAEAGQEEEKEAEEKEEKTAAAAAVAASPPVKKKTRAGAIVRFDD